MKSKINIMNTKPEITDEEIRSLMNFERLLTQKKNASVNKNRRILKNAGFTVIGCVIGLTVWFFRLPKNYAIEKKSSFHTSAPKNKEQHAAPVAGDKTDSISHQPILATNLKEPGSEKKKQPANPGVKPLPVNPSRDEAPVTNPATAPAVYIQAEPEEGYPALYAYFNAELTYPAEALNDSIQGVVMVVFTINTEGKPERISIEQALGDAFDREAVRVIRNMPSWKPATYNDKPVASRISVPLTFQVKKMSVKE